MTDGKDSSMIHPHPLPPARDVDTAWGFLNVCFHLLITWNHSLAGVMERSIQSNSSCLEMDRFGETAAGA